MRNVGRQARDRADRVIAGQAAVATVGQGTAGDADGLAGAGIFVGERAGEAAQIECFRANHTA